MAAYGPPPHLGEEDLEKYASGKATESETERVEEHLLLCEECRRELDRTEAYLKGVTAAAQKLRGEEKRRRSAGPIRLVWAIAAGLAVAGILYWQGAPRPVLTPATIALDAVRGVGAQAPADAPLVLQPDLTGLPSSDRYLLQVVDARGEKVWEGGLAASDARASVPRQKPGVYFVRLYSPDGSLLREYGLRVVR